MPSSRKRKYCVLDSTDDDDLFDSDICFNCLLGGSLIQCENDHCLKWYCFECVFLENMPEEWFCPDCALRLLLVQDNLI